jgi:beta-galactosidase
VTLRFFEPNSDAAAGQRGFDVTANGVVALKRVDPFAQAGGAMKPSERSFAVEVKGKALKLDFKPLVGQAIVSAIEIQPVR